MIKEGVVKNGDVCAALKQLCEETGTKPEAWEEVNGPETGVGIERWFFNEELGTGYYTCDDQGHITIEKD